MGEASAVTAQKLANQTNKQIADDANALNYQMFNEQNQWNLDQWNRENEYNDPSAQMQRLIMAGINPVTAASNVTGGIASNVQSASWPGAQTYEAKPEYDLFEQQRIGNILAASRDVVNAGLGFGRLGLMSEDVDTRKAAQLTRSELDKATAAEMRAATVGRTLNNEWSAATFQTRIHQESQKLSNMEAQLRNLDASSEQYKAKSLEIDENRKLISEQINAVIAGIRQRDEELRIASRNASANEQNAASNALNAEINRKNYLLADERFTAEIKKWNNDTLLQYMYKFGKSVRHNNQSSLSAGASGSVVGIGGKFEGSYSGLDETRQIEPATLSEARACGLEIYQRAADNPTRQNLEAAERVAPYMQQIDSYLNRGLGRIKFFDDLDTSNSSVLNPSGF